MLLYTVKSEMLVGDMAMSLFHKARAEKPPADWSRAYIAAPKFYGKPDGSPFGAIALTEGTETVLPKTPQKEYAVDGKPVADWKVVLVSTTKDCIIGDCDYFCALAKLKNYVQDVNDNAVLIRALSLKELEAITVRSNHGMNFWHTTEGEAGHAAV